MAIDMSAAKAPPRKTAGRIAKPTPVARSSKELREEGLQGLGQGIQALLIMSRQYADAGAIRKHYPPFATEVANIADQYDSVAKFVDPLIQVGPFTALIAVGMPLILQLLANHKIVDASQMAGSGVVPPDVLTSQFKADLARMQTDALREEQEAMLEMQQTHAEYEKLARERSLSDTASVERLTREMA